MINQVTTKLAQERGSALLEFAFVLTIMLSMTFAIIDFGRYVYANNVVRAAAQEGARAGVANRDIHSAVEEKLISLDPEKATISVPSGGLANTVQVDVRYEFEFITPFISASAGGPIQLEGSASMLKFAS